MSIVSLEATCCLFTTCFILDYISTPTQVEMLLLLLHTVMKCYVVLQYHNYYHSNVPSLSLPPPAATTTIEYN